METIDKHWGLFPDSLYPEDELLDPQSLQTDLRTHDHHELEVNFWDQEVVCVYLISATTWLTLLAPLESFITYWVDRG